MSNIKEYMAQISKWEQKFGRKRAGHRRIDLAKTRVRVCERCNKARKRIHRHHKGHEYLFACLNEDVYAERYLEFRSEDIAILCNRCHKAIHRRYEMTIEELNMDLWLEWRDDDGHDIRPVAKEFLEPFREHLIEICNRWLTRPVASGAKRKSGRGRK